ncbi:hypothetical protein [Rhizobium herbae]|uniref:Transcriptional regulator with XRE-family HTH domain n=1 Tax=Rhizobium herbae TaxID=508661 RepID=A0ABS4EW97_9HYPH|nr:hypothetical protein [Rhizobium herbae]MBP1862202.1 transcriptional regulator with XRE-family HTH domain [Rhizobium herbae]
MNAFDPTAHQASPNGPLNPETVTRIKAIKDRTGMSYAALAEKFGFSGTFLHNLLQKAANVNTQHVERIAMTLISLESPNQAPEIPTNRPETLQHSFHLRPDLQIKIELPVDLTEREAERLARFIQSLPVN